MKILQVTAPREFVIRDVAVPKAGPGEVLMRVNAVTTCPQWDLHLRHAEPMFIGHKFQYPYAPGQPGHEATGVIEELGAGVESLSLGDRVSAWRDPGHDGPGCYAQYVVLRSQDLIRVPDGFPDESLAPVELAMCMGTVFRMLKEMNVLIGRRFGVCGLGPAGLVAVQMARAEGAATVVGFDPLPDRRELAVHLGAAECFDPLAEPSNEAVAPPSSLRVHSAVDCVGAEVSVAFLMDHTDDVVALFGVQREDYVFRPRHFHLRLCGYKGHSRQSAEYAVDLIRQGRLNLEPMVTHTMPLEHYAQGIDLIEARKAIKVCFLPWE